MEDGTIRILLAVIGGIIASLAAALIEGSVGRPTLTQLLVMMAAIALILLLTAGRFPKNTGESEAELRRQLDHHRRELYRLKARHQRKGLLTAAEANAWFRNKRAIATAQKQLQLNGAASQPDAIDAEPAPPLTLPTRLREFFRHPAVSLFIVFFLVSLALSYPLSVAGQSLFKDYLPESFSVIAFSGTAEPTPDLSVTSPTPTGTARLSTNTLSATVTKQTLPSAGAATPTRTPATNVTREEVPSATATRVSPTATSTRTPAPTGTAAPGATETSTRAATSTRTAAPTPTPSPTGPSTSPAAPTLTATPTFIPIGTLPAECGPDAWEVEPNSLFETAHGPLAAGLTYCGYLDDTYDFYFMDFAAPGRLTVALQNVALEPGTPPLNLLKLFTAERVPIDWCCYSRQDRIELTIDVHFGRYYILVDNREIVGLPYMLLAHYEPALP